MRRNRRSFGRVDMREGKEENGDGTEKSEGRSLMMGKESTSGERFGSGPLHWGSPEKDLHRSCMQVLVKKWQKGVKG